MPAKKETYKSKTHSKVRYIDTPFDYSNDGRAEERQERDNERNHEVVGRDGRIR